MGDDADDGVPLMPRAVAIEVYCDSDPDGERDLYAVVSDHRSDLPRPFNRPLQEWAHEHYGGLAIGESVKEAGEMIYDPYDEIIEFTLNDAPEE